MAQFWATFATPPLTRTGGDILRSEPSLEGRRTLLAPSSQPMSFVPRVMRNGVAISAQRDQVLLRIVAGVAAKLFVGPPNRRRSGCDTVCGGPRGATSRRRIDTSSCRDAGSAGADFRTTRDPAAGERLWGDLFSGRLLTQVLKESLLQLVPMRFVCARHQGCGLE